MFRYSRAEGTSLASLGITLVGLLAVGVPFYFVVVRQGWDGVARMPYAIPLAAISLAVFIAIGRKLAGVGGASGPALPLRRGNPGLTLAVSVCVVVGAGLMSFRSGGQAQRYAADRSCSAGFAAGSQTDGACHIENVRILGTHYAGRHNSTAYLELSKSDGTRVDVPLATNFRGNVFRGAREGDRFASVQYFDNHVTQVETQSGRAATPDMPSEREKFWTLLGLIGGGVGLFSALVVLMRGVF